MKALLCSALLFSVSVVSLAQQKSFTADPAKSYTTEPTLSVNADRSITFRLEWPEAQTVEVGLEGIEKTVPMVKDATGVWSVTVPPQKPNLYSYFYKVDGHAIMDPNNRWYKDSLLYTGSVLEVRGDGPMPWDRTDIPHGQVTHHRYHSQTIGVDTDYFVYTPAGFDPHAKQKYPVLYLLHGYSDDTSGWLLMGHADMILDHLINGGQAKKMIVVFTRGYGVPAILEPGARAHVESIGKENRVLFVKSLMNEVIPAVGREYPVMDGPANTAIAGLSMGGGEALYAAVTHPERFGYVGAFSPGIFDEFADPALAMEWKAPRKLLFLSCGDRDNLVGPRYKELLAYLAQQQVPVKVVEQQGNHEWPLWRDALVEFVPMLFR